MTTLTQDQIDLNTGAMHNSNDELVNFDEMLDEIIEEIYADMVCSNDRDCDELAEIREHIAYTNYTEAAQIARKIMRNNLASMIEELKREFEAGLSEYDANW